MLEQSPRLTPSVNVDPPKSPPKGYFFDRGASRSPDRDVDNTPFGKVRELISQHSSRASSRPGTPQGDKSVVGTSMDKRDHSSFSSNEPNAKPSNVPPPVNRADKPKIPTKPATFTVQDIGGVANQHWKPVTDARVSPFSTPPSSDEEGSAEQTSRVPSLTYQPHAQLHSAQPRKQSFTEEQYTTDDRPARPGDPRFLGFNRTGTTVERKDSRQMAFASEPPHQSSKDYSSAPVRANTFSERPSTRDTREQAYSGSRLTPRHVSDNLKTTSASSESAQHEQPIRPIPRDPRLLGFSSALNKPANDVNPALPPRRPSIEPPPRPSEESKRSLSRPGRQPSPGVVDRSTKPTGAKGPVATVALVTDPLSKDSGFPPPPKRGMPNDQDSQVTQSYSTRTFHSTREDTAAMQKRREKDGDSDEAEGTTEEPYVKRTEYPDVSQANRRPPFFESGLRELSTITDSRTFDVCGKHLCTTGYVTRVFDLSNGESIMSLNHGQTTTLKVLSVIFKPASSQEQEGNRLWIGNNDGEIQEIDITTYSMVATSSSHNKRGVIQLLRCRKDLWSLDDDGRLFVWPAHENGTPNLKYSHIAHRVQKGHSFSMVVANKLWLATGKELRIYSPGDETNFAVLNAPLQQPGTGEITSGTVSSGNDGYAYIGHADGKVSIYSTSDYSCLGVIKVSDYKINSLAYVGDMLWAAYKTGKIYVYDTSTTPWKVKKDWTAHSGPVSGMLVDPTSVWTMRKLQVVSLGQDALVKCWDGLLEEDWLESVMHEKDTEYCSFREIRAAVVTWNVGATNPIMLKSDFIADAIHAEDPPEILAFGFQEVVDLEDKGVATKGILGFAKKKDVPKPEQYQGGIYREWRDYLVKYVNRSVNPRYHYTEVQTSHLIGLFQCIFIRQEERSNLRHLGTTNVKCGMGGRYGNKGALVTRFILDDSSLCFINCHLAAGQTQTSHRNNDVATILEDESLPRETSKEARSSLFVGGGDGSQILDHEICILNGDLNYRIDTVPRDTVINRIRRNELAALLERDQINVSRRRVSGFRLSPFIELPITFPPTYKYDLHTDNYDTSEKKRSPAWCDRVLYRGVGRVKQLEYRRHDGVGLRVSDHRPVSGLFKIRVKKIDAGLRKKVKEKVERDFEGVRKRVMERVCVIYLVHRLAVPEGEARALITKNR